MDKKLAPQSGQLVRGKKGTTNSIVSNKTANVKSNLEAKSVPAEVIRQLESEMQGINFGGVSLIIAIRDGRPAFRIEKIVSLLPTITGGRE